jgi:hypothetical protein
LKDGEEPPDTTGEFGGAAGGKSREGHILAPIIFPKAPIDLSAGKLTGAFRGVVTGTDSSSDSAEDDDGEDDHKLHKLMQAAAKELLTIEIRAEYTWQGRLHEAIFSKTSRNHVAPAEVLAPLQVAYQEIDQISRAFQGGGLPHSCVWTASELPRSAIEITVTKEGEGVYLRYAKRASSALDMENLPERISVQLLNGWSVIFGASENAMDGELTQRLLYISYQYHEPTKTYLQPWQVRLEAIDMRAGERGERSAKIFPIQGNWDDERIAEPVPYCAREIPKYIEAARLKETQALLKLGRDNQWPIRMTIVSAVSEYNTISIMYDVDWAGINWQDDEVSVKWCWAKFIAKANAEKLSTPPALLRKDITWTPYLRKRNNALWATLKEGQTWGPDDAGPAPMILFGPEATIKMRTTAPNPIDQLMACLCTMYQGRYVIHGKGATREWAMVAGSHCC